jgi:rhodanese-related sulfurtransferase
MAKRSRRKKKDQNKYLIWGAIILVLAAFFVIINNSATTSELVSELPLEISVQEAKTYRDNGAFILDVRTQEEWDQGHIPGATLIPLDELPARLSEIPEDVDIVVVCRSGNRSAEGRDILLSAGFSAVTSMDGGVNEWQALGFPFE